MSTKLERELDHFLYFGGKLPDLSQGIKEVPLPDGFWYCRNCNAVTDYFLAVCDSCQDKQEYHND